MCIHIFLYPVDTPPNYNLDAKTLTGICQKCKERQTAYGMKGAIPIFDDYIESHGKFIDNEIEMW